MQVPGHPKSLGGCILQAPVFCKMAVISSAGALLAPSAHAHCLSIPAQQPSEVHINRLYEATPPAFPAQVRASSWSEPVHWISRETQEDKQQRPDTLSHAFIISSVTTPGCPAGPLTGSPSCPAQPWGGGEQRGFTGSCGGWGVGG